jgi:hypothetical protein
MSGERALRALDDEALGLLSLDVLAVEVAVDRRDYLLGEDAAIRAGDALIEARLRVGYDGWEGWLSDSLAMAPEDAARYMDRTRKARDGRG